MMGCNDGVVDTAIDTAIMDTFIIILPTELFSIFFNIFQYFSIFFNIFQVTIPFTNLKVAPTIQWSDGSDLLGIKVADFFTIRGVDDTTFKWLE